MQSPRVGVLLLHIAAIFFPTSMSTPAVEDAEWKKPDPSTYLVPIVDFTGADIIAEIDDCTYRNIGDSLEMSSSKCSRLPSQYPNRNITVFVVRGTAITSVRSNAFRRLHLLEALELIGNNISTVSPNAFNGLSELRYLNLAGNRISMLDAESLAGLKNLRELVLADNLVSYLPAVSLAMGATVLPSLTHLYLGGNQRLEKLNKDDFAPLYSGNLTTLNLMSCDIRHIHPDTFAQLASSLEKLSLRDNPRLNAQTLKKALSRLQNAALKRLELSGLNFYNFPKDLLGVVSKTNVEHLELNRMNFTHLLHGDFPPMPQLISLTLDGDGIAGVENATLDALESLKKLSMSGNLLDHVPESILLPGLEQLDISGVRDAADAEFEIEPGIFTKVRGMLELNLSFKNIGSLHKNIFFGLIRLERLHLRKCGLKFIDDLAFYHVRYLSYIDLSENPLLVQEFHDESIFFWLELVREFKLSALQVPLNVNDSFLFRLQSLEILDLSHNLITHLHKRMFSIFTSLAKLDLSHNRIQHWDERVFVENKELKYVDLSHNDIAFLTPTMIEEIDGFQNVTLAFNPFSCDCSLRAFLDWIPDTNVTFVGYHPTRRTPAYTCGGPSAKHSGMTLKSATRLILSECDKEQGRRYNGGLLITMAFLLTLILVTVVISYMYQVNLRRFLKIKDIFAEENYQYDAFVSYNVNDSEWVFSHLVPSLENDANNMKLCVYDRDFVAGRSISECILESIRNSRKVILVLSNSFIESPWCRFEADLAHHTLMDDNREGLVLIKLEELDSYRVTPQLNFLLKTRIYLAWSQDPKEQAVFWKKLHRAVERPKNSKLARRFSLSRIV